MDWGQQGFKIREDETFMVPAPSEFAGWKTGYGPECGCGGSCRDDCWGAGGFGGGARRLLSSPEYPVVLHMRQPGTGEEAVMGEEEFGYLTRGAVEGGGMEGNLPPRVTAPWAATRMENFDVFLEWLCGMVRDCKMTPGGAAAEAIDFMANAATTYSEFRTSMRDNQDFTNTIDRCFASPPCLGNGWNTKTGANAGDNGRHIVGVQDNGFLGAAGDWFVSLFFEHDGAEDDAEREANKAAFRMYKRLNSCLDQAAEEAGEPGNRMYSEAAWKKCKNMPKQLFVRFFQEEERVEPQVFEYRG